MMNDKLQLDDVQYDICETQGLIFETIAGKYSAESFKTFVKEYMCSEFCRRQMDVSYSRYQMHEPEESLDFVIPEISEHAKLELSTDSHFPGDTAFWIGFTYRQVSMKTCLPSAEIIKQIPLTKMLAMYPGLHTVDETMALEIIMESFHLPFHNRKV